MFDNRAEHQLINTHIKTGVATCDANVIAVLQKKKNIIVQKNEPHFRI